MRQQRNDEAKALIGSRVGTAKAIFTQHSASGQMHSTANAAAAAANRAAAPAKPARNSIAQRINTFNNAAVATTTTPKTPPVHEVADVIKSHMPAAVHEETEDDVEAVHETEKTVSMAAEVDAIEPQVNRSNGHETETVAEPIHTNAAVPVAAVHSALPAATVASVYEEDTVAGDQYSTIKRSPYTKQNSTASSNSQVATPVEPEPPTTIPDVQVVVAKTTTTSMANSAISASDASQGVVIKNGKNATIYKIKSCL